MTKFNLIDSAWLPAQRNDGTIELIQPSRIVEQDGCAFQGLAAPRADFNGALMQFLIGLLQTAFAPPDGKTWRRYYDTPPTPEELQDAFGKYRDAFNLDGDGPRFMQDFQMPEGEEKPLSGLLMDAPGGQTVRNNQDHFIKRGIAEVLCPACAAAALHCLQTNAPSGGQGHRVGLRGGGPLTTLVIPAQGMPSLWRQVWLNVLPETDFRAKESADAPHGIADIFPWLAPTRSSEGNRKTTPPEADLLQMYWGMPRRIRLIFGTAGTCDLCDAAAGQLATGFVTKNFGVSYDGWRHVLSPYAGKAGEPELPVHGQPGGAGFRHWVGWVVGEKSKYHKTPAAVVSSRSDASRGDIESLLWAFGYDMDNMKARAWVESRMPLIHGGQMAREAFEDASSELVHSAMSVAGNLREAVKSALYGKPEVSEGGKITWKFPPSAKLEGAFADALASAYWRGAEAGFWEHLRRLESAFSSEQDAIDACKESWLAHLSGHAEKVFGQFAERGGEESDKVKAQVLARAQLGWFNRGDALRKEMHLPLKEDKQPGKSKGGKS